MAAVVSGIAGVLGALGMLNNMAMSVFERRREFGVLRALGCAAGESSGWSCWNRYGWPPVARRWDWPLAWPCPSRLTRWPPTAVLVQGDLSWTGILAGSGLALAMAILGSSYPAYQCTRASPISACAVDSTVMALTCLTSSRRTARPATCTEKLATACGRDREC